MSPQTDSLLRPEIIGAQESRTNLFQHKLTVVAALGAVGLGLDMGTNTDLTSVWLLIPWVCIYVDLLAHQLETRIIVIHHFLHGEYRLKKAQGTEYREWDEGDYEHFAASARSMEVEPSSMTLLRSFGINTDRNAFRFENDLVDVTTLAIILVSIVGPFLATFGVVTWSLWLVAGFVVSGLLALTAKLGLIRTFALTRDALRGLENRWVQGCRLPVKEADADTNEKQPPLTLAT